jgi:hypothetical protein
MIMLSQWVMSARLSVLAIAVLVKPLSVCNTKVKRLALSTDRSSRIITVVPMINSEACTLQMSDAEKEIRRVLLVDLGRGCTGDALGSEMLRAGPFTNNTSIQCRLQLRL